MLKQILNEIDNAFYDINRGGHFMGLLIGGFTVWPLSWLVAKIKERRE